MADGQLEVKLVPDEQALEEVEKKQLEVSGEADSVQEAKEMNEEQNESLGVISRSVFSMLKKFAVVIAILTPILIVLQNLADVFDISFQDVRTAIVEAIDILKEGISDTLDVGNARTPTSGFEGGVSGFAQGFAGAGFGQVALNSLDEIRSRQNQGGDQNMNVNLLTSRDQMLGDSTQQNMQSERTLREQLTSGSGGNQQP